jgi:hypothetical protein
LSRGDDVYNRHNGKIGGGNGECDKPLTTPATATTAKINLLKDIIFGIVLIFAYWKVYRRLEEDRGITRKMQRELRNKLYSAARFNEQGVY